MTTRDDFPMLSEEQIAEFFELDCCNTDINFHTAEVVNELLSVDLFYKRDSEFLPNSSNDDLPTQISVASNNPKRKFERVDEGTNSRSLLKGGSVHHGDVLDDESLLEGVFINRDSLNQLELEDSNRMITSPTSALMPIVAEDQFSNIMIINEGRSSNQESQLRLLLSTPSLIQQFFNVGNVEKIRQVIESTFVDDAHFVSSVSAKEKVGRFNVVEMFTAALRTMPDAILISKRIKFNRTNGILNSLMIGTGTKQFSEPSEKLFFAAVYGPPENVDLTLRQKIFDINNSGGHCMLYTKLAWSFHLNEDRTKFTKFVQISKLFDVRRASNI